MTVSDVIAHLETIAPSSYQESYDNARLIAGNKSWEVSGALCTLDCIETTVDEAIEKECNLIVAHHPIVFSGLKSFTGKNYVERTVIKAIKNDIAIYAIHTNLDNVQFGVNDKIADIIGLTDKKILRPKANTLSKIQVFAPKGEEDKIREAMRQVGAGTIGLYEDCSFNTEGLGTYLAKPGANPSAGEVGVLHREPEVKIEMILPTYLVNLATNAMKQAHPYEEVAYDVIALSNSNETVGSGLVGNLSEAIDTQTFLKSVKSTFGCGVIKHTAILKDKVQRIAVCGGAGGFLLNDAKRAGADVFITSDYKYHEYFDADGEIVIADIGHYESEQFTIKLLGNILVDKFDTFATHFSERNTNPVNYI